MNPVFKKNLLKWALCCGSLLLLYALLEGVGIIFGVALCFVIIKFM